MARCAFDRLGLGFPIGIPSKNKRFLFVTCVRILVVKNHIGALIMPLLCFGSIIKR
jgi:hypothetical protein